MTLQQPYQLNSKIEYVSIQYFEFTVLNHRRAIYEEFNPEFESAQNISSRA